jgi:filamentous hemagglutinin
MNQGMYKLVYSKLLNMFVPASEAARSHSFKNGKRIRKHAKNSFVWVIASFIFAGDVLADPAGLVPGTQAWVNASITGATSNSLTITQSAPKAILDWQKLNLNVGELLQFNQQGQRTWSALNRIHDLNPSILNGSVQADGNVYFINTNGIIFGPNAQFNVGSLYAGTLDITNDLFNSGFINSDGITQTKVFEGVGGFVTVEKGAQINAASGGKVLLFAPSVSNSGIINTPDGQTILAAGKTVYLASSKDPAGFLVEVDSGGTATNLGKIVAERGNITMMGLAVNQEGTLSATTTVRANGSIRLLAQDGVDINVSGTRNGSVTLAQGSVTEVKPEYTNKEETIASQPFTTSDVKIEASLVNIDGTISAKGGNVTVDASQIASDQLVGALDLNSNPINPNNLPNRIYLGKNAVIDVSGVDAVAPMSRNQLEIQLFSDQLKDAPILRDGGLFKNTVYVDARKGTQLFDVAPFVALKGATVAEKMTKAGAVSFTTPNDVIAEKGSVINVSGGSTTYEAGTIRETNLFYNGKLVPISEAKPGVPYDKSDIYSVKDSKWGVTRSWDLTGGTTQGWGNAATVGTNGLLSTTVIGTQVAGYFEGDDAGTLTIQHPTDAGIIQNLVLSGSLLANTKASTQQLANQTIPKAGKLLASANDLLIAKNANEVVAGFTFDKTLDNNFQSSISTDVFQQGFNDIDLSNVKKLTINDAMQLNPNGKLILGSNLDGFSTQINADIIAPSSEINLNSNITNVADGVTISTAGNFTNDKTGVAEQFSKAAAVNGGSINAGILTLGQNVTMDASAGASVDNTGALKQGQAGNIKFTTLSKMDDSVTLQAYGFKQGGTLDVKYEGQLLNIAGDTNLSSADIDIAGDFFNKGGFSKYSLSGFDVNIGGSTDAAQEIYTAAQTWQMNAGFANQAGGQPMSLVALPTVQPDATRKATSFNFTADKLGGVLSLAENTTIRTDRGGSVSLAAGKQVNVLGDIITPSGAINISINDKNVDPAARPYDATQAIFIGNKSTLSALGSSLTLPDSQPNLLKTQLFNAGTISVDAPKGAVVIKDGAVLDVSGTSVVNDTKTPTGYNRETLHGDAGTIKISASDGLLLDGTFKGTATGTGRSGTLEVGFSNTVLEGGAPYLKGERALTLTQQKQLTAQNFAVGDALKTSAGEVFTETSTDSLKGQISAEQVQQGGFANLNVGDSLNNSIQLEGGLDLKLTGNLKLETQLINIKNDGVAKLSASAITFKKNNLANANTIATGHGALETNAKQVYFDGLTSVAGVDKTSINASLDMAGINGSNGFDGGGLIANGDINLTARQIYPSTDTKLKFEAIGDDSTITVNSSGVAPKPVYSAAGILSLKSANVVQNGVLTAPFGQIDIDATKSATFTAGSITSVSANGLIIPYNGTSKGGQFFGGGTTSIPPPEKSISIKSKNVDLQKNAIIDLSGGGDMQGYEWITGIGGSKDVLAQPNMYAVIPDFGQNYTSGSDAAQVGIGQSVYLTGVPGLASGYYTLLPARYALVPGAFMVEAKVTGSALLPTQIAPQLDGATLTTGYFADLGTGSHDANWSTFRVTDGAIFHPAPGTISKAPSQYILTSVNEFFSNPLKTNGQALSLPKDVARLSLDATKLTVEGIIDANKQQGGKGLQVDISSDNIRVVNSVGADDGSLQLTASSLNALNADSLLLGGKRNLLAGVSDINTSAETVTIENNSSNVVKTPEFIAAARDKITVKTGAVIDTGAASAAPAKTTLKADGDGALLALSSNNDISYSRTGGSAASAQGTLDIQAGSNLHAGRSVVIDATKLASLNGNVSLQDGGSATFGANRILLGAAPQDILGLDVSAAALAQLGQLKALTLNSYNNIDTFGSVNFGNSNLDLTLNAAGIAGHLASGETSAPADAAPSVITAKNFTLKNTQGATFTAPVDPSDRALEINANTVKFDGGKTELAGFTKLDIKADEVRVANVGETNFNVAETKLTTGRITADNGADYKIKSAAKLEIAAKTDAKPSTQTGFGAKLDIAATDLTVASNIDLTSGNLSLSATNDLNIAAGARLNASSTPITYYNTIENAPAGSVTLTSTTGNVNVVAGAVIDVTSQGGANAGLVKVLATNGTANIAGDLKGAATGTGKGGVLDVDVNTLADLTATNSKAAGFSEGRQYRVRTGDVKITGTLANANALAARDTIVSADAGKITVTGDIIATAPKNSRIGLFAGNGVTLTSVANLQANSTQAGAEGGKLTIETTSGELDFKVGSQADTSAGAGGKDGKVYLGAARTADNLDINVANMGTTFVGARKIDIGGLDAVETATVGANEQTTAFDKAEVFMQSVITGQDKGLQRLGLATDSRFAIVPVVEFKNTNENVSKGNLTLADTFNLHTWRFDPVTGQRVTDDNQLASGKNAEAKTLLAGVLNLRAKGDVLINATLSDGFYSAALDEKTAAAIPEVPKGIDADGNVIPAIPAIPAAGPQGIESWTYNIVAGADFSAANPLATKKVAMLDPSISATKASTSVATIANTVNSSVKLTSKIDGYNLVDAPIVAIRLDSIKATSNAKAGVSTKLNISNTGEKDLVNSNGAAIKKSDLTVGVTYLAKYDAASDKYKLIDGPDTPDVMLANGIGVRTGTGNINIAAAGDLVMVNSAEVIASKIKPNASIYTVGQQASALAGFESPASQNPLYLTNGGDINIATNGNIVGGEPATGRQLINQWLFRQGSVDKDGKNILDTTWWVRPDLFKQSLATLGGGNISINAGGNISNFSASAPTTARYDTNSTTIDPDTGKLVVNSVVNGGGDVKVHAAGDIVNGVYFVAKGEGEITAGGSIKKPDNTFGTTLALQDGSFNVTAGKNAYIETVINPTLVSQATANAASFNAPNNSYFNSYSAQAAVNVSSLTGNAEFGGDKISLGNIAGLGAAVKDSLRFNPGNLKVVSHNGDASIGDITLLPSATGNLQVLAANNVNLGDITMADADPSQLPTINKPIRQDGFPAVIDSLTNGHSLQLLHKNDVEPVLVVAQNGDISNTLSTSKVILPKAAKFIAGHDIIDLNLVNQNNNASDVTLLKAGNDIKVGSVYVAGPGELLVQAGRNIDLTKNTPDKGDIATIGNFGFADKIINNNPALPAEGSSITLQAGLGKGANVQGYIDQYILPTGVGPAVIAGDATKSAEYRTATAQAVTDYMHKTTGNNTLTEAQALAQFNAASTETKTIFANRHLTSELIASAKGFAKAGNHDRGNSAITTLFPTLNQGDILLYASKVSTNSGGSIDLIASGGLINVGAPGIAFKDAATKSGEIGVITEKGGEIRAIANGDFQVNQSKVITQFGSDIAVWSTTGTIDAGRGSKTATSIPTRIVQTDADGNTIVEVRGVASGSGIRAQSYDEDGPNGPKKAPKKGNVFLTAPVVDAGEAGIEAGDLLIVAPIVLNATNIQVSGTSSGVPIAATTSLAGVSAGLSPDAVNSATAAVTQNVAQSANQSFVKPTLPSLLYIDLLD